MLQAVCGATHREQCDGRRLASWRVVACGWRVQGVDISPFAQEPQWSFYSVLSLFRAASIFVGIFQRSQQVSPSFLALCRGSAIGTPKAP